MRSSRLAAARSSWSASASVTLEDFAAALAGEKFAVGARPSVPPDRYFATAPVRRAAQEISSSSRTIIVSVCSAYRMGSAVTARHSLIQRATVDHVHGRLAACADVRRATRVHKALGSTATKVSSAIADRR